MMKMESVYLHKMLFKELKILLNNYIKKKKKNLFLNFNYEYIKF